MASGRSGVALCTQDSQGDRLQSGPKALSEDSGPLLGLPGHCKPRGRSLESVSTEVCFLSGQYLPSGLHSQWETGAGEGDTHCHTESNSRQTVATAMRLQGPQIMSCPLGAAEPEARPGAGQTQAAGAQISTPLSGRVQEPCLPPRG